MLNFMGALAMWKPWPYGSPGLMPQKGKTKYYYILTSLFIYEYMISILNRNHYKQISMENGGVDRTVIDGWQHQLSQMADFPLLLTSFVFDL